MAAPERRADRLAHRVGLDERADADDRAEHARCSRASSPRPRSRARRGRRSCPSRAGAPRAAPPPWSVVLTITVPEGASPAIAAGERPNASWKMAITCGVSTGLLVRISRSGCGEAHEGLDGRSLLLRAVRGEVRAVQSLPQHAGFGEHLPGEVRAEASDRLEADAEEAVAIRAELPHAHAETPFRKERPTRGSHAHPGHPLQRLGISTVVPPRSARARMGSGARRARLEVRSAKEERWPPRSGRSPPPATSSR